MKDKRSPLSLIAKIFPLSLCGVQLIPLSLYKAVEKLVEVFEECYSVWTITAFFVVSVATVLVCEMVVIQHNTKL